jgi:nicotinamide phosphoribosyltransferase
LEKHGGKPAAQRFALPFEGTLIQTKNALMTIVNTDPEFPWLTNWAETILLQVWYPITVGTLSFEIQAEPSAKTSSALAPRGWIDFKLHDFGFRGVSSLRVGCDRRGGAPVELPRHRHAGGDPVHSPVLRVRRDATRRP